MIVDYLPKIFGTISLLGGIYGFLYYYKIYVPKLTTETEKAKYEEGLKKFGKMMRVLSIFVILYGGYLLFFGKPKMFKITTEYESAGGWTKADSVFIVEGCAKAAYSVDPEFPNLVEDYCICNYLKIKKTFNRNEYIEFSKKTKQEQMKILKPMIDYCKEEMKHKQDSLQYK